MADTTHPAANDDELVDYDEENETVRLKEGAKLVSMCLSRVCLSYHRRHRLRHHVFVLTHIPIVPHP